MMNIKSIVLPVVVLHQCGSELYVPAPVEGQPLNI